MAGFRGRGGEMTVRVPSGSPERWTALRRVHWSRDGRSIDAADLPVEASRAYRDRLVLKLGGIDDPSSVEAWRGGWILAPADEVPDLPAGEHFVERLRGLRVTDEVLGDLGAVVDVIATGGADLLVVEGRRGEILVPFVGEIVREVREGEGTIRTRVPAGLVEEP